jgi:hypothetical protein
MYNAKSYTDLTNVASSTAAALISGGAAATLGTLSSTVDCLVVNMPEVGITGSYLTQTINTNNFALYGIGKLIGTTSDGIKLIQTMAYWVGCSQDIDGGDA